MTDWFEFLGQALDQFQEVSTNGVFAIVDGIIKPITPWEVDD